jgi:hypothetical protein
MMQPNANSLAVKITAEIWVITMTLYILTKYPNLPISIIA